MRSDELTYTKAVRVSAMGLAIQAALSLILLLYALFSVAGGIDHAALTVFLLAVSGLLPWLGLIVVYHQHKLAAIEALEAERFDAAAASSVFEHEDLHVAQRRLNLMYKFLFPTISIILAIYLIGIGLWRLSSGKLLLGFEDYVPADHPGWGIALGAIIGLCGFIFASFVAGMSSQKSWQNLRGGAGIVVGTALAAFALAITLGIDKLNTDLGAARYLQVILPGYMIVLGAEIILNFLLNVYRPRSRGEIPRLAFDSQILALIAQPQSVVRSVSSALSYQFGFEVGDTWFYQLLSRTVTSLFVLGVVVVWGLSCLIIVEPNEQAIITRFGRVVRNEAVLDSGIHVKAPWPIERVERFESMRIHQIQLSAQPDEDSGYPILWTNEHSLNPHDFVIVAPTSQDELRRTFGDEGSMAAVSENADGPAGIALMNAEVPLQYRISDVLKFVKLAPDEDRASLLQYVAQRELMKYMAPLQVDQILGPQRLSIGAALHQRIQDAFDQLGPPGPDGTPTGAGVHVVFVGLSNVHPPMEVAEDFQQVVQAQQQKRKIIGEGERLAVAYLARVAGSVERSHEIIAQIERFDALDSNDETSEAEIIQLGQVIEDLLRNAGGEAAVRVNQAQADRWAMHMNEWARALSVQARTGTFHAAPNLYRWSKYLEVVSTSLHRARIYINTTGAPLQEIRVNLESQDYQVPIQELDTGPGE